MRHATLHFRYLDPAEKIVEFDKTHIEFRIEFPETISQFVAQTVQGPLDLPRLGSGHSNALIKQAAQIIRVSAIA